MNNYRVTFLRDIEYDYWGKNKKKLQAESYLNFSSLSERYYPIVRLIRNFAIDQGVKYIWFFFEPYVEITWYSDSEEQAEKIFNFIDELALICNIKDVARSYPKDGNFADWFCNSDLEREFGGKRHGICADLVALFNEYKSFIHNGKGKKEQVKRTIHTICNPLGLNYKDEAYICFSRGLICLLFCFFSFEKAVWIYRHIFRQKY